MKLTKYILATASAALLATGICVAQEKPATKPGDPKAAPRPARPAMDRTAYLAKALNLSDEQKAKIKPIMEEEQTQLTALIQDKSVVPEARMAKIKEIRNATTAKVTPLLTEGEQREKWERMRNPPRRPAGAPAAPGAPGGPAVPGAGAKPAAPAPAK
jgi:hypothetical protein